MIRNPSWIHIKSTTGWKIFSIVIFLELFLNCLKQSLEDFLEDYDHGLLTPNEAFFHWNPELLGLGRQIGERNPGAFAKLSAIILVYSESLVHVFHYSTIISTKKSAFIVFIFWIWIWILSSCVRSLWLWPSEFCKSHCNRILLKKVVGFT